ncbi:hypothetical protein [Roseisalinus antarcticus]|nr:hypothetical protein [Roseisalinus antarcticus]
MIRALVLAAGVATGAVAQDAPYAGQDGRAIAQLGEADVAALLAGEGWGLARPAELNGFPGPSHVLELADELALSDDQRHEIEQIFHEMQNDAAALGARYVETEAWIDELFGDKQPDPEELTYLLRSSGEMLAQLRGIHLMAHIRTAPLLTPHQRMQYASLRGYGAPDHAGHEGGGH